MGVAGRLAGWQAAAWIAFSCAVCFMATHARGAQGALIQAFTVAPPNPPPPPRRLQVLEEGHAFTPSGAYCVPPDSASAASYRDHIQALPAFEAPEVFGMHANANIAFQLQVGHLAWPAPSAHLPPHSGRLCRPPSPPLSLDHPPGPDCSSWPSR
jgi:hypothetical protein